jgi:redox-sensing transcriptional repressor
MANLSEKVLQRLTFYYYILVDWAAQDQTYISSPMLAEMLGIDDSQVRKDLKLLNNVGKNKVGYEVKELKASIEKTLGLKRPKSAWIIGAGNLGAALAKYDNFAHYGLRITALFDNSIAKVKRKINGLKVFHTAQLMAWAKKHPAEIAILTVPAPAAQNAADLVIAAGAKYIWNFAPAVIKVPTGVKVWYENIMGDFISFTAQMPS